MKPLLLKFKFNHEIALLPTIIVTGGIIKVDTVNTLSFPTE